MAALRLKRSSTALSTSYVYFINVVIKTGGFRERTLLRMWMLNVSKFTRKQTLSYEPI